MTYTYAVTERILYRHFHVNKKDTEARDALKIFCQEYSGDNLAMLRAYFRLVKAEVEGALIDSALVVFSDDILRFARIKYGANHSIVKLEQEFFLTRGQLNIWRHRIIETVWRAINYKLTLSDVYYPSKIVGMVEALATLITIYTTLDPAHQIVSEETIKGLEQYHLTYRTLLNRINECLAAPNKSREHLVVTTIINHPHSKKERLARLTGLTQGTFARYVQSFEKSIAPYVF